jgi:hypothetical protein
MLKRRFRLPSPALVISLVALSLVLGGTAVAASASKHKDVKADIKLIKKLAPTLSVKHAKTANSATTAASAASATHATSADSATHATSADSATSATNATNATNATTAANANALGGVAASGYVKNSGDIYYQVPFATWAPRLSTDPFTITRYSDAIGFDRGTIGSSSLVLGAGIPTSLYGKALALVGFQMCYSTNTGNAITSVYVYKLTQTTAGNGGSAVVTSDSTTRSDDACRTYSPASPVTLTSADQFQIYLGVNWTSSGTEIWLGRVTAILRPTSTAGPLHKGVASRSVDPNAAH